MEHVQANGAVGVVQGRVGELELPEHFDFRVHNVIDDQNDVGNAEPPHFILKHANVSRNILQGLGENVIGGAVIRVAVKHKRDKNRVGPAADNFPAYLLDSLGK